MAENIGDIDYKIKGDITPLEEALRKAEQKINDLKQSAEKKIIGIHVKVDDIESALRTGNFKVKVNLDTSDFERQLQSAIANISSKTLRVNVDTGYTNSSMTSLHPVQLVQSILPGGLHLHHHATGYQQHRDIETGRYVSGTSPVQSSYCPNCGSAGGNANCAACAPAGRYHPQNGVLRQLRNNVIGDIAGTAIGGAIGGVPGAIAGGFIGDVIGAGFAAPGIGSIASGAVHAAGSALSFADKAQYGFFHPGREWMPETGMRFGQGAFNIGKAAVSADVMLGQGVIGAGILGSRAIKAGVGAIGNRIFNNAHEDDLGAVLSGETISHGTPTSMSVGTLNVTASTVNVHGGHPSGGGGGGGPGEVIQGSSHGDRPGGIGPGEVIHASAHGDISGGIRPSREPAYDVGYGDGPPVQVPEVEIEEGDILVKAYKQQSAARSAARARTALEKPLVEKTPEEVVASMTPEDLFPPNLEGYRRGRKLADQAHVTRVLTEVRGQQLDQQLAKGALTVGLLHPGLFPDEDEDPLAEGLGHRQDSGGQGRSRTRRPGMVAVPGSDDWSEAFRMLRAGAHNVAGAFSQAASSVGNFIGKTFGGIEGGGGGNSSSGGALRLGAAERGLFGGFGRIGGGALLAGGAFIAHELNEVGINAFKSKISNQFGSIDNREQTSIDQLQSILDNPIRGLMYAPGGGSARAKDVAENEITAIMQARQNRDYLSGQMVLRGETEQMGFAGAMSGEGNDWNSQRIALQAKSAARNNAAFLAHLADNNSGTYTLGESAKRYTNKMAANATLDAAELARQNIIESQDRAQFLRVESGSTAIHGLRTSGQSFAADLATYNQSRAEQRDALFKFGGKYYGNQTEATAFDKDTASGGSEVGYKYKLDTLVIQASADVQWLRNRGNSKEADIHAINAERDRQLATSQGNDPESVGRRNAINQDAGAKVQSVSDNFVENLRRMAAATRISSDSLDVFGGSIHAAKDKIEEDYQQAIFKKDPQEIVQATAARDVALAVLQRQEKYSVAQQSLQTETLEDQNAVRRLQLGGRGMEAAQLEAENKGKERLQAIENKWQNGGYDSQAAYAREKQATIQENYLDKVEAARNFANAKATSVGSFMGAFGAEHFMRMPLGPGVFGPPAPGQPAFGTVAPHPFVSGPLGPPAPPMMNGNKSEVTIVGAVVSLLEGILKNTAKQFGATN
jgi:hypothetical protein